MQCEQEERCSSKKKKRAPVVAENGHQDFVSVSERCYDLFFDNFRVPVEVTEIILRFARLGPIVRRGREIAREKLVC